MKTIRELISSNYFNSEEIIEICEKYDLLKTIEGVFTFIEKSKGESQYLAQNAGTLLASVNPKLAQITSKEDKHKIEMLLADFIRPSIDELLSGDNTDKTLNSLVVSLKSACEINQYDLEQLFRLIGLDRHLVLRPKMSSKKYYYDWNLKPFYLDEFARSLLKNNVLLSPRKELIKLFDKNAELTNITFNQEEERLLLVVFLLLHENEVIKPRCTNGKFAPLNQRAVDIDGGVFFKVQPNKRLERIKRNKENYNKIRRQAMAIISSTGIKGVVKGTLTNDP